MFSGEFRRVLDSKNRVTFPSSWLLGAKEEEFFSVADDSNQFVRVRTPEELERIVQVVEQSPKVSDEERKEFMPWFYGQNRSIKTDTQGRVVLPVEQCQTVGLRGDVVLVGSGRQFDIWPADLFEQTRPEALERMRAIARKACI